jgi:hypothetical protein
VLAPALLVLLAFLMLAPLVTAPAVAVVVIVRMHRVKCRGYAEKAQRSDEGSPRTHNGLLGSTAISGYHR